MKRNGLIVVFYLFLFLAVIGSTTGCVPNIDELTHKRDVDGLIKALDNREPEIRRDAAKSLGTLGVMTAVDPLIVALKDPDPSVRTAAIYALNLLGDPRAVEPFIISLKDEDVSVRIAAAQALGYSADPRAADPLIITLKDEDLSVREAASDALIRIGEPAVKALSTSGDPQAVDILIAILIDDRGIVSVAVANALGEIGDLRAVDPLIEALINSSGHPDDTRAVANALIKIDALSAVDPLILNLKDNAEGVRQVAAEVLGVIGSPAVESLIKTLEISTDWKEKIAAAEALGIIGDPRAIKPLIQELDLFHSDNRVVSSLAQIGKKNPGMLLPFLRDQSTVLVYQALIVLGDSSTVPALIEALNYYGVDRMALDYILCGNDDLAVAAREWAGKRGYQLVGTASIHWGSAR